MGIKSFSPWGVDHLAVILLTATGVVAILLAAGRLRGLNDLRWRRGIALALLANEVSAWICAALEGRIYVPLQLCDLAAFLTIWALWNCSPAVSEVAYFWGLAGSIQAIITPDLLEGFPNYWWFTFFVSHCGTVLSVVYLAVSGRVVPTRLSILRIWILSNAYAVVAFIVDSAFGMNYGYLAAKPAGPSLLDYFGPWPWYLIGMEAMAIISFAICYAPFEWARYRAGS